MVAREQVVVAREGALRDARAVARERAVQHAVAPRGHALLAAAVVLAPVRAAAAARAVARLAAALAVALFFADPVGDADTVTTELMLADMESLSRRSEALAKKIRQISRCSPLPFFVSGPAGPLFDI